MPWRKWSWMARWKYKASHERIRKELQSEKYKSECSADNREMDKSGRHLAHNPPLHPIQHTPPSHAPHQAHAIWPFCYAPTFLLQKNNIPGIERYFGLKRKSFTSGWMGGLWSIQIKTRWMGRVERIIKVTMTTMHHSFQKSPYILVFLFDDGRKSSVGLEKIKTVTRNPFPTISACCSAPPSPQPQ